jgi:hypothetical protein
VKLEWRDKDNGCSMLNVGDSAGAYVHPPINGECFWQVSMGEQGKEPSVQEAKQQAAFMLKTYFEAQLSEAQEALEQLSSLDEETLTDRLTFNRGIKPRVQTSRAKRK